MEAVHEWAAEAESPLHVHLSEQVAENQACVAEYARTPTEVLADHGLLGPRTTAVHATHLTEDDIRLLGESRTYAGFCPTTERDLGDGIGPSRRLHDAGSPLTLGSDSHAVIDLFEEMRAVELDERLATQQRGHWSAAELLAAATTAATPASASATPARSPSGSEPTWSRSTPPAPRTAGTGADENTAVFAAVAEDVTQVMVDGKVVVRQGDRAEIGRELDAAIGAIWKGMP